MTFYNFDASSVLCFHGKMKTIMKCTIIPVFLVTCLATQAAVNDSNRYQVIGERNPFGLKPPQQAPVETAPAPAIPKVFLTGITDITGIKQADRKSTRLN